MHWGCGLTGRNGNRSVRCTACHMTASEYLRVCVMHCHASRLTSDARRLPLPSTCTQAVSGIGPSPDSANSASQRVLSGHTTSLKYVQTPTSHSLGFVTSARLRVRQLRRNHSPDKSAKSDAMDWVRLIHRCQSHCNGGTSVRRATRRRIAARAPWELWIRMSGIWASVGVLARWRLIQITGMTDMTGMQACTGVRGGATAARTNAIQRRPAP